MSRAELVGLVVVSHSAALAAGLAELAGQMAPDVTIVAAGGDEDGGLGTDFDAVSAALGRAQGGAGVVLLYDLGSAKLVADLAVEMLGDPGTAVVVDAPLVEGAVAAAVAAQGGASMDEVLSAAASALAELRAGDGLDAVAEIDAMAELDAMVELDAVAALDEGEEPGPVDNRIEVELTNDVGLHARPAGMLVRSLAGLDAEVTVANGARSADARSVLALLGLGAQRGAVVTVTATGPDAAEALARVRALADKGFTA